MFSSVLRRSYRCTNPDCGDGYVIRMKKAKATHDILLVGANARSVIYAQDTLFQLLTSTDGKIQIAFADVDDWPGVPWRGRPQTSIEKHFKPGNWEAYLRGRTNFIDIRDSHHPSVGQYACQPDDPLDPEMVGGLLDEAHQRGLFVYGTVNCSIPQRLFEPAMEMFESLINAGADGLWISHDDPGAPYRYGAPLELVEKVLALGKKYEMTGHKIAIVPAKGSYGKIVTDVNRGVCAVPGMEEALWFFTTVPAAEQLDNEPIDSRCNTTWLILRCFAWI